MTSPQPVTDEQAALIKAVVYYVSRLDALNKGRVVMDLDEAEVALRSALSPLNTLEAEKADTACELCGHITKAGEHHSHPCAADSGHPDDAIEQQPPAPQPTLSEDEAVEIIFNAMVWAAKNSPPLADKLPKYDKLSNSDAACTARDAYRALMAAQQKGEK